MDCPKCNLRYNTSTRKPKIAQCGHTFCQKCGIKIFLCPICQNIIDKTKSTINHSLMQMLQQKKKNFKDIDKFIKVCFVGESKVGKTSLINRLKGEQYRQNTISTIGYDFAFEDRCISNLNVRFQLWDSAGQERYRAVSPLHYKNSDIVVIVYDVTQDGKSNNVLSWYEQAAKHCPQNSIKILVGNKMDLFQDNNVNVKSINPLEEGIWKVIASQKIANYQVSCKSYEGIEQFWKIIEENVEIILKRVFVNQNPFIKGQAKSLEKSPRKRNNNKLRQIKKEQLPNNNTCCT